MPLDLLTRNVPENKFNQSQLLKSVGKSSMGGFCLALSCAFITLRREGHSPNQALGILRGAEFVKYATSSQELYSQGEFSGGSVMEAQELPTIVEVFRVINSYLVMRNMSDAGKISIIPAGITSGSDKGGLRMSNALFPDTMATTPMLYLLIFNLKSGRLGISGAHAVAFCDDGIFDPNYGWMPRMNGFNNIDRSVILNEFANEYGITNASTFQDISHFSG